MTVLLTGGAGYIGGHVVDQLRIAGEDVVVVDNLSTGVPERIGAARLYDLDLSSGTAADRLALIMREHAIESVVHIAAKKQVAESMAMPAWYYHQNVGGLANVLLGMQQAGATTLVFSSSAAVYGNGAGAAVREADPTVPMNPYGETKLVGEWLIRDAVRAGWLRASSLRYFNVAGASSPILADRFALNLIPMVFERLGAGDAPRIFGADYPTPDGTCVRDYVHVADLADAHLAMLASLRDGGPVAGEYNIGTGTGYSVRQVLQEIAAVTGVDIPARVMPRRPGDPASLVADTTRIAADHGWRARFGLRDMVASAWQGYRQVHP